MLVVRTWHDAEREAVVLEINDDGPGIPDDVQPKIFDPFFTTKDVGKGTGLGLTVAYAIVQEHGGRIRLESQPGSGASFYVELPVTGADLPRRRRCGARLQTLGRSGRGRVDPGGGGRRRRWPARVAEALRDAGYVVDARRRRRGGARPRSTARQFDLVICDLKMPRLDGKAFYRALAQARPALIERVIFVTGDVAGTDAEQFLEESGCRWLAKPFRLGRPVEGGAGGLA